MSLQEVSSADEFEDEEGATLVNIEVEDTSKTRMIEFRQKASFRKHTVTNGQVF